MAGQDTLVRYFGNVYDVAHILVLIAAYVIGISYVVLALRERCKNSGIILFLALTGIALQILYTMASVNCTYSELYPKYDVINDNLNRGALIDTFQMEYMYLKGIPNKRENSLSASDDGSSSNNSCCVDFKVPSVLLTTTLLVILTLGSISQTLPKKWVVLICSSLCGYFYGVSFLVCWMFINGAQAADVGLFLETKSDIFWSPVCQTDSEKLFIPVLIETFCLYGPSLIALLYLLQKYKGNEQLLVFKECLLANGKECKVCSGSNELLEELLKLFIFVILCLRPLMYIYSYTNSDKVTDVILFGCYLVLYFGMAVHSVISFLTTKSTQEDFSILDDADEKMDFRVST